MNSISLAKVGCVAILITSFLNPIISGASEDPYEVLGVTREATQEEIVQAYRRLAQKNHPDKKPNDPQAEERFKSIQRAFEILRNPEHRNRYDQYGEDAFNSKRRNSSNPYPQDEIGKRYSNDKWVYDFNSHRFYDNRLGIWLSVTKPYFSTTFYSPEGWLFRPDNGSYNNVELGAEWNPSDKKGWHRNVSNFNDNYIQIDPRTGFALSVSYKPKTVSDASDIFDRVLNPVSLINQVYGIEDRAKLLEKFYSLKWTNEQQADFIERSLKHIEIFNHPDMQPHFTTHVSYVHYFISAILDNTKAQEYPEIVVEFINKLKNIRVVEELVKRILIRNDWYNHQNSESWLRALFQKPYGSENFIYSLFRENQGIDDLRNKFSSKLELFFEIGLTNESIRALINSIYFHFGSDRFDSMHDILLRLVRTSEFSQFIANHERPFWKEHGLYLEEFFRWFKEVEPRVAETFISAIKISEISRDDFYRFTPDGTERRFQENDYNLHKQATVKSRLEYLKEHLPRDYIERKSKPVSSELEERSHLANIVVSSCMSLFK